MKILDQFVEKPYKTLAPVFAILFITLARILFEASIFSQNMRADDVILFFTTTAAFYLVVFFLFSLLLRLVLSLPFEKVANTVSVGLIFGLIPPIIDLAFSYEGGFQYIYFSKFTWTLFSWNQPPSESIALWAVIAGCGIFTFMVKRSIVRAVLATAGAYGIFIGCTAIFILVKSHTRDVEMAINLVWLGLSFLCYLVLRGRDLLKSLLRLPHALPHALLAICGAAWIGKGLSGGLEQMLLLVFLIFVIIVQNDYYDTKEDEAAGRDVRVGMRDVVWTNFFLFLLIIWVLQVYPILALVMALFFVVGLLYHHPSVRLKERFCLSYKCEGITALLAFLAGTIDKTGFPKDVSLFIPGLLVLGGGTLVSIPKDWKDVESDREAGIPSYYVVLTRKGRSELTIQRWIVAIVTFCLLVPPVSFLVDAGAHWAFFLLGLMGFVPGAALLLAKNRKVAVASYLGTLAVYMFILAVAIGNLSGQCDVDSFRANT